MLSNKEIWLIFSVKNIMLDNNYSNIHIRNVSKTTELSFTSRLLTLNLFQNTKEYSSPQSYTQALLNRKYIYTTQLAVSAMQLTKKTTEEKINFMH